MLDSECFRVLGVPNRAPETDIKRAYRSMVKQLHPDTGLSPDNLAFSRVVEAYRHLSARRGKKTILDFPVKETRPPSRPAPKRHPETRATATGPKGGIFDIGSMLLNGKTPHQRAFAAMRLGNSGRVSCYPYLKKGLRDKDPIVVTASLRAVARLKIVSAEPELTALFTSGEPGIKLSVLDTVAAMGNYRNFKGIILQGMKDNTSGVRRKSLQLFKDLQHQEINR